MAGMKEKSKIPYDVDVVVVGGGPAGLSAAVRARWIKRYKAVVCSTLVVEASEPGGLAGWRGCMVTGPAWQEPPERILGRFREDMERLHIPVVKDRVCRIENCGAVKKVITAGGRQIRCLGVVIATGIKVLANEKAFLGRGLSVTSMGYEHVVDTLRDLVQKGDYERLVVVGSQRLTNLMPLVRELNTGGRDIRFVIEAPGEVPGDDSDDLLHGWVTGYHGEDALAGLQLETQRGTRTLDCDRVLLEFNSYELRPCRRMVLPQGLEDDFITTDADMATELDGIFAAGDVTRGGYNSFSRAMAQGIAAGLSVYRHVHRQKFGREPVLFAYRPTDFVVPGDFRELPEPHDSLHPFGLLPAERIRSALSPDLAWLAGRLDGNLSVAELAQEGGMEPQAMKKVVMELVEKKMITLHTPCPGSA